MRVHCYQIWYEDWQKGRLLVENVEKANASVRTTATRKRRRGKYREFPILIGEVGSCLLLLMADESFRKKGKGWWKKV